MDNTDAIRYGILTVNDVRTKEFRETFADVMNTASLNMQRRCSYCTTPHGIDVKACPNCGANEFKWVRPW